MLRLSFIVQMPFTKGKEKKTVPCKGNYQRYNDAESEQTEKLEINGWKNWQCNHNSGKARSIPGSRFHCYLKSQGRW